MNLRWSYLNSYLLNPEHRNTVSAQKNPYYKQDVFSRTLKVTKYGNFKIFKRTLKFRKYTVSNSKIVRRKYVVRKRLLNNLKISVILRYWAKAYKKLRQFWRFYQNYGIFNLNITSSKFGVIQKSVKSLVSMNYVTVASLTKTLTHLASRNTISTTPNSTPFVKSVTKYSHNSYLSTFNSPQTLEHLDSNKHLTTSLIKFNNSYFPYHLLSDQNSWNNKLKAALVLNVLQKNSLIRALNIKLSLKLLVK